jgi:hypothetical protein
MKMDGSDSDRILIFELTIDRYGDLMALWRRTQRRDDIRRYSMIRSEGKNA